MSRSDNPWRPHVDIRRGPGRGGWCAYVKGTEFTVKGTASAFLDGWSFRALAETARVEISCIENATRFWDWEARHGGVHA